MTIRHIFQPHNPDGYTAYFPKVYALIGLYEFESLGSFLGFSIGTTFVLSQLSGIIISLKIPSRYRFVSSGKNLNMINFIPSSPPPRCRVIALLLSYFELIHCERVSQPTKLSGPTTFRHVILIGNKICINSRSKSR
jgi:hypothetical protein